MAIADRSTTRMHDTSLGHSPNYSVSFSHIQMTDKFRVSVFDGNHYHMSPDLPLATWVAIFVKVLAQLKGT